MKKILSISLLLISILSFGQGKKVVLRVSGTGGGGGVEWGAITGILSSQTDLQAALDLKAPLANPSFTGTVSGITKTMVGLGNVENTALSTWAGSTNISNVGTITTGGWEGASIGDTYISSAATWNAKESALTFSTGLTRNINTITNDLSTGVSGGQSVIGGTGSGNDLILSSTSNVTKGKIIFGASVYDEVNNYIGIGQTTPTAKIDITTNNLGVTQTDASGISLVSTTDAATGAQQISPAIRWRGEGYKSNATAASQVWDWQAYVLPVQGTSVTTSTWKLQSQMDGGGYTDRMTLTSAGLLSTTAIALTGNISGTYSSSSTLTSSNFIVPSATSTVTVSHTAAKVLSANARVRAYMTGSSTSTPTAGDNAINFIIGTQDITIAGSGTHALFAQQAIRPLTITAGAGTVTESASLYIEGSATGATNNYSLHVKAGISYMEGGTIFGSTATLKGYTVATLPAGTVGMIAYVTDATVPTYNAALTGGGAVTIPVFYNGSAWVSH